MTVPVSAPEQIYLGVQTIVSRSPHLLVGVYLIVQSSVRRLGLPYLAPIAPAALHWFAPGARGLTVVVNLRRCYYFHCLQLSLALWHSPRMSESVIAL